MRYIIDRKTNEHERYDGQNYDATKYRIAEADSEGWIKHKGNVCPLPDGVRCEVKWAGSSYLFTGLAKHIFWHTVTAYRPFSQHVDQV